VSTAEVAGRHAANDGSFRRSVLLAAGRATALVAAAVLIGILVLQATDDNSPSPRAASTARTTTSTRPSFVQVPRSTSSTVRSTTTTTGPIKKPDQLHVIVVNASGRNGAAAALSTELAGKGYQMLTPATARQVQAATVVYFKPGFEREAEALKMALGKGTAAPLPKTPPAAMPANAELMVVLGSA